MLLLHRSMPHEHVVAGIAAALAAGALTADAVAVEARKAAQEVPADSPAPGQTSASPAPVVSSLTARRLAALPADTRPPPSVAIYDQLLRQPRTHPPSQGDQP